MTRPCQLSERAARILSEAWEFTSPTAVLEDLSGAWQVTCRGTGKVLYLPRHRSPETALRALDKDLELDTRRYIAGLAQKVKALRLEGLFDAAARFRAERIRMEFALRQVA